MKRICSALIAAVIASASFGESTENHQKKIAEMQKSIASLREEIAKARAERNSLQLKMEQSDQAIAGQIQKITAIESEITANRKNIEALETEKKS